MNATGHAETREGVDILWRVNLLLWACGLSLPYFRKSPFLTLVSVEAGCRC